MFLVIDKGNRVADIFFETDLPIVGILAEGRLVFASKWLLLIVFGVFGAADEREFEETALDSSEEH
jgi:hypothetical protein